ncbi:MAG TPA: SDR family oxidoreductase [Thermoanaerobaculia bacterium]|nr:SDR family oxidoreductase [Thermoanaerobaculia bacterium]
MSDVRVALVTAASRGMGAACARELAERGYALGLLARSPEVFDLAREVGGVAVQGSVAEEADLARLVAETRARFGRIDAVVANTGHVAKGELLELSDQDWHDGLDLLLLHVVRLARLLTPAMAEQGRGAFVNISSFAAREPALTFPVSAALRAALGNFAKLFAQRYGAAGLRMNNLLPGWIDTHPVASETQRVIPMGRAGTAEEVAKVAAFLLSDDASYVNGESLLVDGGLVRTV